MDYNLKSTLSANAAYCLSLIFRRNRCFFSDRYKYTSEAVLYLQISAIFQAFLTDILLFTSSRHKSKIFK